MCVKTPRGQLAELREEQTRGDLEIRGQIMDAMLVCCGEVGYRRVAVERVYRRYGGYRSQFYRHFGGKAECFLAAYESEADALGAELLAFARADGDPRQRLQGALGRLAAYAQAEPAKAKAVFFEVHVAGAAALRKRREVIERLTRALDRACRKKDSCHSPPPITAEFMISAVDQALSSALLAGEPERFRESVPDLTVLILQAFA